MATDSSRMSVKSGGLPSSLRVSVLGDPNKLSLREETPVGPQQTQDESHWHFLELHPSHEPHGPWRGRGALSLGCEKEDIRVSAPRLAELLVRDLGLIWSFPSRGSPWLMPFSLLFTLTWGRRKILSNKQKQPHAT